MIDVIAQILGIGAMLLGILSFQCMKARNYYIMVALSGLLFSVNYIMIGAFTGAVLNFLSIIRAFIFVNKKRCRDIKWLILVCGMYMVSTVLIQIFFYVDFVQLVLALATLAAMLVITYAMWLDNPDSIRWLTIFVSSPIWILHNSINFTIGGICCDTFNIISAIVYLIRVKFKKPKVSF